MATRHENGADGDDTNTDGNKGKTQITMGPQGYHDSKGRVHGCSLVMLWFGTEPKFEPELCRTGPRSSLKFRQQDNLPEPV